MKTVTNTIVRAVFAAIAIVAVIVLLWSFPTMWLWNWLMPDLFGLKSITWTQALGLCALCSMLFKSSASSNS